LTSRGGSIPIEMASMRMDGSAVARFCTVVIRGLDQRIHRTFRDDGLPGQ
jgi:hypothetical protein